MEPLHRATPNKQNQNETYKSNRIGDLLSQPTEKTIWSDFKAECFDTTA